MKASNAHGADSTATEPATVQECPACQANTNNPHSGRYHFSCLQCCVRLVAKARPNRKAQEGMLAAIAMSRNAPVRSEILLALKRGE